MGHGIPGMSVIGSEIRQSVLGFKPGSFPLAEWPWAKGFLAYPTDSVSVK